jgi:hypothetical protein
MELFMNPIARLGLLVSLFVFHSFTSMAHATTICVYDPSGKSGDFYRIMKDFSLEAAGWGSEIELSAFTDELIAVQAYEAGQCSGVLATGVRLQRFNNFPTTLEAIGALTEYGLLKDMLKTLSTSKGAAKMLKAGEHETMGILTVGAAYMFLRDRSIDTVGELAGKKIATLTYDKPSMAMVKKVGAVPVPADLSSIGPKFNNGSVDACYISAPAYAPFELERGLGTNGGIMRLPLAQATLQLLVKSDEFPAGFGTKSRQYFFSKYDEAMSVVTKAEAAIPSKYWIELPKDSLPEYDKLFQSTRIQLRDVEKSYDGRMLKVMFQLRCKRDPSRVECLENLE